MLLLSIGFNIYSHTQNEKIVKAAEKKNTAALSSIKEKLTQSEEKLALCYADRANSDIPTKSTYDFSSFGVYSPLLANSTVSTQVFDYKDSQIEVKVAPFTYEGTEVWATVWSMKKGHFSPTDFPIFIGYENPGNPTFLSEITSKWNTTNLYKNKAGEIYHYTYEYWRESVQAVRFESYSPFSPLGRAVYISITMNIKDFDGNIIAKNDPKVAEAKRQLEKIVDTFQVKL